MSRRSDGGLVGATFRFKIHRVSTAQRATCFLFGFGGVLDSSHQWFWPSHDVSPSATLVPQLAYQGLLAGQWECPCVMLRDGSQPRSSDAGNRARGDVVPLSDVPEKERVRLVDAFLFCDLGLSETLVRSECVIPKCAIEIWTDSLFLRSTSRTSSSLRSRGCECQVAFWRFWA